MKSAVFDHYGSYDKLRVAEVPTPEPREGEVRIRVRAAAVNKGDWHLLHGSPFPVRLVFGLRKPRVGRLGSDVAGVVDAVGPGVTAFSVGDAVFGDLSDAGFGAFAEQVCAPASALARKPGNVTFEQAGATAMAGQTALQAVRDTGGLSAGQRVLINGASGNVGMLAVQVAKALGATVTGVCGTRNVEMVRALGADHVIDYRHEDFTTGGGRFDLVVDTAAHRPVAEVVKAIRRGGTYVMVGGSTALLFKIMLLGSWMGGPGRVHVKTLLQQTRPDDIEQLRRWMEEGRLAPPVDRTFLLGDIAGAIRYFAEGKPKGKVVVTP